MFDLNILSVSIDFTRQLKASCDKIFTRRSVIKPNFLKEKPVFQKQRNPNGYFGPFPPCFNFKQSTVFRNFELQDLEISNSEQKPIDKFDSPHKNGKE